MLYSGVRLVDVLEYAGLGQGGPVLLRASDLYSITLDPATEEGLDHCLFATRLNGEPLVAWERGPFRLIWAHNAEAVGVGAASSAKWIWNIVEIRAVP